MKYLLLSITLLVFTSSFAQVNVSQGSNSDDFKLTQQPVFTSFPTDNANYFMIRNRNQFFQKSFTVIAADKSGTIIMDKDLKMNAGIINNSFDFNNLLVVGKGPVAFIENHDKNAQKNTLTARLVDNTGNIAADGVTVGSLDMAKMSNPGDWYVALCPDKKQVAVIGKVAHEKNMPDQFKYFILDENLKETSKGQFSFAGNIKEISILNFMASDKGDLYIVAEDYDKSYKFPILYQYSAGTASIIPVMIADPDSKNLNYTCKVNPAGNLVMAGYMQKKQSFTADPAASGTWLFTSAKPSEVKTFKFDKPVTNMTARNIVYNGDTFFLVGEQYLADKDHNSAPALSRMALVDTYNYLHNDIMVTGFSADHSKKFEMTMSHKWASHGPDQDLTVASGIVNNKLLLVYNDEYGKYIEDKYHRYNKLPVAVSVTNDGLMEAPIQFAKQLDVVVSTYTLLPAYFSNNDGKLMVLSGNVQAVKTVTFQ